MAKRRYSSAADPTRDRILAAALELISETAVGGLSVRRVATAAGVNVATVHYYFGTKDALIAETLRSFFGPLLLRLEGLGEGGMSPAARLAGFLAFYLELFHEHPGVFTSLIEAIIAGNIRKEGGIPSAYEEVLISVISLGKSRLRTLVGEVSGIEDPTRLSLRTIQLMTSLVHPLLISTVPKAQFGLDFGDPELRASYVRLLVDSLSPPGPASAS